MQPSESVYPCWEGVFDVEGKRKRKEEIEKKEALPSFWQDPQKARSLLKEKGSMEKVLERWDHLQQELEEVEILIEIAEEEDEGEGEEAAQSLQRVEKGIRELEIQELFDKENDPSNAFVSINAGAGGTEAQDWAEMLLRMYLRWAERKGYRTDVVDILPGEEAGIKNVTFLVEGDYAYGYLKAEAGVHRLVRISPFDTGRRRHTSFASVAVFPETPEEVQIEIKESDLRIDTFRASGPGGQHVNKTDSAVRITHLPTGIVVQCQSERSQHKNKAMALKVLKARLYELEMQKRAQKMEEIYKSQKEIAWGSQIRSYILHPYKLVKDHRTGLERGDAERVLDGDLDPFIEAYIFQAKG